MENVEKRQYTSDFYEGHKQGSLASAQKILKIVTDELHPKSMIDIGCGIGLWLKVAEEEYGVVQLQGVEGDYISASNVVFDIERIHKHDLKKELDLQRRYDLAISMEVGEHLPEASADAFVKTLTNHADFILFSAANIGQEGTYHINEQMPEYWAQKFKEHNYVPIDFIRSQVWNEPDVMHWYKQNVLLFVHQDSLQGISPRLQAALSHTNPNYLFRVHPDQYLKILARKKPFNYIHYKLYQLKKLIKE